MTDFTLRANLQQEEKILFSYLCLLSDISTTFTVVVTFDDWIVNLSALLLYVDTELFTFGLVLIEVKTAINSHHTTYPPSDLQKRKCAYRFDFPRCSVFKRMSDALRKHRERKTGERKNEAYVWRCLIYFSKSSFWVKDAVCQWSLTLALSPYTRFLTTFG